MALDLLNGEFLCCGALCDKNKAQQRINEMQAIIDEVAVLIIADEAEIPGIIKHLRQLHKDLT